MTIGELYRLTWVLICERGYSYGLYCPPTTTVGMKYWRSAVQKKFPEYDCNRDEGWVQRRASGAEKKQK
ncbi:hypothetical protein RHMOL_Rhmol05G0137600 [Rhododendron molle]|uniref:Uncharacterized protein n=1 Tax=Rhododendron molle TaxID=49168 RepID=A0ACC0NPR4_RHOML|nr:hypothetical protein RHMOL_Rhmol05G0137600 [Rhododendron molle]